MQTIAIRRIRLPTTLGFAPLDDRTRLPGRFFYRLVGPSGPLR